MIQKFKKFTTIIFAGTLLFVGLVVIPYAFFTTQISFADYSNGDCPCGNCSSGCSVCSSYSQGDYYGQGTYYSQSGYYNQSAYYVQATYYLQGGYWAPVQQATITVTPQIVHYGDSVQVSWDGGNAAACTLSGGGLSSTLISGTTVIPDVTGESVITLTCNLGPNISSATGTIKVLPEVKEN
jgi:hypothetical protein